MAKPRNINVRQVNESMTLLRKLVRYLERQDTYESKRLAEDAKLILNKDFDYIQKSSEEINKPIPGYEGLYFCYEDGVIKSVGRMVRSCLKPEGYFRKGWFLRPRRNKEGYLAVRLTNKDGKCKTLLVSRVVALTYLGQSDLYVNHIDGDKLNNNVSNLEYVTQQENVQHYLRTGLKKSFKGGNPRPVKLIDINTGEESKYPSIMNCAKSTKVDITSIQYHLEREGSLFKKKYKVKYAS